MGASNVDDAGGSEDAEGAGNTASAEAVGDTEDTGGADEEDDDADSVRETRSAFLERDETLRIELRTSSRGKRSAMSCLISRVVLRRAAFNQSPTDSSDKCGAIKLAALRWISPRDIASPTSGNFRAARATPMRLYATPSEKHKTLKQ
jgi:hypothetical protein